MRVLLQICRILGGGKANMLRAINRADTDGQQKPWLMHRS